MAVGMKGKQLAELAPGCAHFQLVIAATSCREHVPKVGKSRELFNSASDVELHRKNKNISECSHDSMLSRNSRLQMASHFKFFYKGSQLISVIAQGLHCK